MDLTPQRKPGESFRKYKIRRHRENLAVKHHLAHSRIGYQATREFRDGYHKGQRPYISDVEVRSILHNRQGFK